MYSDQTTEMSFTNSVFFLLLAWFWMRKKGKSFRGMGYPGTYTIVSGTVKPLIFIFFVGWILLAPGTGLAQETENEGDQTEGLLPDCTEVPFWFTSLIPAYHLDNHTDSLDGLLTYWQELCGAPEPMVRSRIIYQIETNTFSDDWYPDHILNLLNDYKSLMTSDEEQAYYYYYDYYIGEYLWINPGFNDFTINLASFLQRYDDLQPIEKFFLEFYANNFNSAMNRLEGGELAGTRLDTLYRAQQLNIKRAPKPYVGIFAGKWQPNGNLARLGNHPQIGLIIGSTKNRILTSFNFMVGFGNTPKEYSVVFEDQIYTTKNYLSVHAGFDLGIEMIRTGDVALLATTGIAFEGFDAFTITEQETLGLTKPIGSFNFNFGGEFRIYTYYSNFIGFQAKHHILSYRNRGGTDLSGNAVTFGVVLGFGY